MTSFRSQEKPIPTNIHFTESSSSIDIIQGADIILHGYSSAGLEAIILKKPVIYFNFTQRSDYSLFSKLPEIPFVKSAQDLMKVCHKLNSNKNLTHSLAEQQNDTLKHFLYPGSASDSISKFIVEQLAKN